MESDIKFTYMFQIANKYTFEMPQLKAYVESWCHGKVLNLFAGKTKLNVDETRIDSNPDMPADYHMDAEEFCKMAIEKGWKYDKIILDPPYSLRKSMEKYKGHHASSYLKILDLIPNLVSDNGIVISLGYYTGLIGKNRGFKKLAICIVTFGGITNDTLVSVDQKIGNTPRDYDQNKGKNLEKWFNVTN